MPPTGQAGTGAPRLRGPSGPRTVRAKIICLLMVPVVSLLALWGYATVTTAQDVSRLRQVQRADAAVRTPVAEAVTALQAERAAAVRRASDTAAVGDPEFTRLAQSTDRAVARLRLGDDRTVADGEALPRAVAERLDVFVTAAERLRALRAEVREGRAGWARTYERYTAAIDGAFRVGGALTGVQDAELGSDARVLLEFARAGEALARRSQVLVHRQLSLLDSMERRSDDPDELSDLFRLDHLTTRMRRHAESLIILSGAAPGRAWRKPVPLTDVVRAAVSEAEDYARVEVRQLAETSVAGAAVADLTHLLAEIIENAAQFSPPHTRVRVTGEPVGNGYAVEVEVEVEVEDRGLGMGKEALAEANRRITESEALDLFDSDRLGLFVVSRLAARHAVKVHLKASPYGGTTAARGAAGAVAGARPEPPGQRVARPT
ncbi:Histidine kinase-, DNA gyrase B-, and HSP90-like ATPase [Streptomyces sp. di188]|nr:Histidine kinase-, DNA gyrase B-, and HSP90-like ATPase [Streptomyces sp. di50b]SCE42932.1 Histidine kinase-, DNA gyrase B-, and HSP90-like ATPase [Streptomyces sp. di188]